MQDSADGESGPKRAQRKAQGRPEKGRNGPIEGHGHPRVPLKKKNVRSALPEAPNKTV